MKAKTLFGYVWNTVLTPSVGLLVTSKVGPELGAVIAGGLALIGSRVLHLQPPPQSTPPQ